MNPAVDYLMENGPMLAAGVTVVLSVGVLAVAVSRAPIHRQKLAQLAVAAALCWLVVAAVPMPRPFGADVTASNPGREPVLRQPHEIASAAPAAAPKLEHVELERADLEVAERKVPVGAVRGFARDLPASVPPSSGAPSVRPAPVGPVRAGPRAGVAGSAPESLPWPWWLAIAYLAGAAAGAAYLLLGCVGLRHILRRSRPPAVWLQRLVEQLAAEQLDAAPRVRVTARACSPFCFGIRRPTIVLPAMLCRPDQQTALCHVLRHEMAHLSQRDSRGHALLTLALPVLFCHPLYWWLRSRAHLASELVADDLAARQTDAHAYAQALIGVSEQRVLARPAAFGAASVLRSQSEFYRRMKMLLQRESRLSTRCSARRRRIQLGLATALVAGAAGLWGVAPLPAQHPEPSRSELRVERDKLRAEIVELRAEVAAMKALLEKSADRQMRRQAAMQDLAAQPPNLTLPTDDFLAQKYLTEARETLKRGDFARAQALLGRAVQLRPDDVETRKAYSALELAMRAGSNQALPGPRSAASQPGPVPAREPVLQDAEVAPEAPAATATPFDARSAARPTSESARDNQYVMGLVTASIDLEGEMQIARMQLQLAEQRAKAQIAPKEDVSIAKIKLHTIERKFGAVRKMIDAEIEATRYEIENGGPASLYEKSNPVFKLPKFRNRIIRLEARLQMLETAR